MSYLLKGITAHLTLHFDVFCKFECPDGKGWDTGTKECITLDWKNACEGKATDEYWINGYYLTCEDN